jgi:hypothetical protein
MFKLEIVRKQTRVSEVEGARTRVSRECNLTHANIFTTNRSRLFENRLMVRTKQIKPRRGDPT